MDDSFGAEGPAILKLRKWAPFSVPLNLSEFREAFISPSRHLLLLLSYQCEAVVLPITEGVSKDRDEFEGRQSEIIEDADRLSICSQPELPLDSLGDKPCVSGSSVDSDYGLPSGPNSTSYQSHPYIYGVKSLAWGVCDDAHNNHKGVAFREFLFVSGAHGLKVHAFRQFNKSSDINEPVLGQGRWVEWGPGDATSVENVVCEASAGVPGENADDAFSRKGTHKKWLRSFVPDVETVRLEGNLWTKFPEMSSFPCGADVVSFSLFDDILPLLEFFSHDSAMDSDGSSIKAMRTDSSAASVKSFGLECSQIFSSSSHHLIGFYLTPIDCDYDDGGNECGLEKNRNLVVVSRLSNLGIRWVSLVKLQGNMTQGPAIQWVDFCFSENLVACLSSCGVIFLYLVASGIYVSQLDVMKACGLYCHINAYEEDQVSVTANIQKTDKVDQKSVYASSSMTNKRLFRRLVVAPYTSLLAAIGNSGVAYVLNASDFVPAEYLSSEKLFPHFQHSGLGKLMAWVVGGSEIDQQKAYSDLSSCFHPKSEHEWNGQYFPLDENGFDDFWKTQQQDLHVVGALYDNYNGSSVASRIGQQAYCYELRTHKPQFMRTVFLPTNKSTDYDCICFSPFGLTRLFRKNKDPNESQISHTNLRAVSTFYDDNFGFKTSYKEIKEASFGEAVGCTYEGCFYLVTQGGLSVFLPSVSVSKNFRPIESIGCRNLCPHKESGCLVGSNFWRKEVKEPISPWKVEIVDRVILFDGLEAADKLCLENGWDLQISRIRALQMAVDCLKFDEIQQYLEGLVDVNLSEEGILRLIFAVVYLIFCKSGNDYEVSAASRLLSLATSFATKTIRKYGLLQNKNEKYMSQGFTGFQKLTLPPPPSCQKVQNEVDDCRKLLEMAKFLEIIRHLQLRLCSKIIKAGQGLEEDEKAVVLTNENSVQDASKLLTSGEPIVPGTLEQEELYKSENLAMVSLDPLVSKGTTIEKIYEESALVLQEGGLVKNALPLENPKEMIARWKIDNLDLKSVVKDALLSGRLPLAVLQLHLHRSNLVTDNDSQDTFTEIRDVGIAIAYDLFLKGETGLAVAMLQRLGENLESSLKQLLFGTLKRSLRVQLAEELNIHDYLGPYEWKTLEQLSLIERLYPSCSFWKTFVGRKNELMRIDLSSSSPEDFYICLLESHPSANLIIKCGEVNGAVLGPWENLDGSSSMYEGDDDNAHAGYWVAAAVWSDAWDQRTVDRIILDQPHFMGIHVPWEAQLEYHICHNNKEEVSKLLNQIPTSVISPGNLQVSLDCLQTVSSVGCNTESNANTKYICSPEELDSVFIDVPEIKVFRSIASNMSCMWLRTYMEQELVKKFIFLKEFWEGTEEIVPLLASSGIITSSHVPRKDESGNSFMETRSSDDGITYWDITMQALHKLVVHHCVIYNLPNLLDLYLDKHNLAIDEDSLCPLLEAAGDCDWARWMLLSRSKGREYDASFANARSIISQHSVPDSRMSVRNIGEMICTVDDVAEVGSELAAIATLMYSRVPIQNCVSSGSVNRHGKSSAQCTLENLRHSLQQFPTLWRTLVAACYGQDTTGSFSGARATNAFGGSELSEYLNWRNKIFYSCGYDTSLLQMLPYWFPKAIRRLVQLFVQGPLGWHSLSGLSSGETLYDRDIEFYLNGDEHSEISAVSWEATIQKRVEEELYDSSLVELQLGLEHHLHRGRALAAFIQLIGARIQKLKSERLSADSVTNVQLDVQRVLSPLTQSEKSLLSSVNPLAIMHFENSMLVASCVFLLDLCGISASILRLDVAALRRISIYYKSIEDDENRQQTPKGSALNAISPGGSIAESLAQALADEYMHQDNAGSKGQSLLAARCPSRALLLVLQHLEKASLPQMTNVKTCGYWLLSGDGDGNELRSQQKVASQHWKLVTFFCQMHQLPLSTKYLALLARDNDWVGFLSEAQVGGYPFETVLQVASKEFSDPRLRVHITTVLKGTQSRNKSSSSSYLEIIGTRTATPFSDENLPISIDLFGILAECEKQKYPGKALLVKAKELSWSLLAVIASCFTDVTPLSCLTVWLEITAARETSSIKVNDIASQIASSVGMAVTASNSLPPDSRSLTFHYNRQNPKRRRLIEPVLVEPVSKNFDMTSASAGVSTFLTQIVEEEKKSQVGELVDVSCDSHEGPDYLSKMVAVLCEQNLFLPLLRAFEMFLPSCSLLPFIRALQAFSQMRLSEASAHLDSFSTRIKEELVHFPSGVGKCQVKASWISSTAVKGADAMLSTCTSPYEKRCLLQLLAATEFGDGGSAAAYYRRLYWKINLAEPLLRKNDNLNLGNESLDDLSLLTALENNGHWEQARNWARQLETSGGMWKNVVHRVTETQAESMVAEWKEFLWDVPEERVALWSHCQTLFIRYSFPPLQAGLFFLKHAETVEKDLPAKELHELLLLALQWLSGMITLSNPVYPLHLLREIETRAWLLAVEAEAQVKSEDLTSANSKNRSSVIDGTASIISKMDNHINVMSNKLADKHESKEYIKDQSSDAKFSRGRRKAKVSVLSRRSPLETSDKDVDAENDLNPRTAKNDPQLPDDNFKVGLSFSKWEERVGPMEMERAVLSLLEFGQVAAAKQLQQKLSPAYVPFEFILVDCTLKLAAMSTPKREVNFSMLDEEVQSVIQKHTSLGGQRTVDPLEVLETLVTAFSEGKGRGLCKRITAIVKAANTLGLSFYEAFEKQPAEVLQLLSLKAQESFEEAKLLVQTHSIAATSMAQILAESFLKGLLAAHRGGYMDLQKEEGPSPLLWRFSDFLKWAELCPSEPEIGHALMRLVITGQEIPHACEVELLILSHHFYKSSACLDGVDVLVALAATRVETYVSEGDFACLARLLTGVGNFQALNFILGILIENDQLEILLQKYSAAAEEDAKTAEAVKGFRMSVLTSLKHFNPYDLDAIAMVYNHFDMKHEAAALLESRADQSSWQWFRCNDKDQNEDLLDSMRFFIEAAEVHSSLDAGNKTRKACAQASLVSLQIRMPDIQWLHLSDTNARRILVEQSRFQEALIVAEAYGLNQSNEWAPVLWNQMLKPELVEEFVAEFVAVLPLQPSMLVELAKYYRAEVVARGDQTQFSVWLKGGGMPSEWARNLGRSFRCLLRRTRDLRLRLDLARVATGFTDVIDSCLKALDRVPENAGPLVLRKGHGGAYLPLM